MDALRERHGQRVVDAEDGDCLRASMSYLLGVPNDPDLLPHSTEWRHVFVWNDWLGQFGLTLEWDKKRIWRDGLWIASVLSKNLPGSTHAIVMRDQKVEFDPSPKRRYRKGTNMLGHVAVLGGYYIVVSDFQRLSAWEEWRP